MLVKRIVALSIVTSPMIFFAGCGNGDDDPAGALAALAGRLASNNDLREVRFTDLNGDGVREVLLVYGPRELLNFDVYYRDGESWLITPPVNDHNNPREFVSTRLESILDTDSDGSNEIQLSSRLYDGNTMVKEVRWSPEGYEVLSQRTVIAQAEPKPAAQSRPSTTTSRPSGGTTTPVPQTATARKRSRNPNRNRNRRK